MNTFVDLPRPSAGAASDWTFPAVRRSQLAGNGIPLQLYDLPGQHVAAVRLVVDLPLDLEPREREGVAAIMSRTLDEGTLDHSAEEFADLVEAEGASYGVEIDYGAMNVQLEVPISRLASALRLMAEAVTRPAFPDQEVARHVKMRIGQIAQTKANAAARIREDLYAAMFADDCRLARPLAGSENSLEGVDRDAVADFYARQIGPARATLIVAGDLGSVDLDLTGAAEDAFGGWQASVPQAPRMNEPTSAEAPQIVVVSRPGSVQTELAVGCPGPDRRHPRWAAHTIAAYILGGTVTSRLDAVLREEKGYTYGMRAQFTPFRRGGTFVASGSVRGEVTGPAVEEILGILRTARAGFEESEVDNAREFLTKIAPLRYETASGVADQAASNVANDMPVDHVDRNLAALRRSDAADVATAYAESVNVDGLTLVAVGDAETIVPALEPLGYAGVRVIDA